MKKFLFLLLPLLIWPAQAYAALHTENVEYKEGETTLVGYLAYDEALKGRRPAVLVVHEWTGLGDYAKKRTEMLAEMGYLAFAADIYGKGVRPGNPQDAGATASIYKNDRELFRRRVNAGFEVLRNHELADASKTAAIGYCFGGTAVLELARSGAPVKGVVSFHGGLDTPMPATEMKPKVLALAGGDDPYVPQEQVQAFEQEMRKAGADWQLVSYGGAVHSFTNPDSGNDPSKGAAYNEKADIRSWEAMKDFFREIFA